MSRAVGRTPMGLTPSLKGGPQTGTRRVAGGVTPAPALAPGRGAGPPGAVEDPGTGSHKATNVFRGGDAGGGEDADGEPSGADVDMLLTVKVRPVARTHAGERLLEYTSFVSYKSVQTWTLVLTLADFLFSMVALFAPGWHYVGLYGSERRGLWAECKVETCADLDEDLVPDYLIGTRVLMFLGWIFILIVTAHRVILMAQHGRKYGGLPVVDPLTKVSTAVLLGALHLVVSLLHMIAFSVYLAEEPDMGAGDKHVGYCVGLAVWVWISEMALGAFFFSVSGQYKRRPFVESVGMQYVTQVALAQQRQLAAAAAAEDEGLRRVPRVSLAERMDKAVAEPEEAPSEKDYFSEDDVEVEVDLEVGVSPFAPSPRLSEEDKALQNAAIQEAKARKAAEEAEALVLAHAHAQAAKIAVERRAAAGSNASSRAPSPGTVPGGGAGAETPVPSAQPKVPRPVPPVPKDEEEEEEDEAVEEIEEEVEEGAYVDSTIQSHVSPR